MPNVQTPEGSPMTTSLTLGLHHLGLTVPNLKETADFFIQVLGFQVAGEKADYPAIYLSDGTSLLTLWQAKDSSKLAAFDRQNNIGLHHFALLVESPEALNALHDILKTQTNVSIEFAPELLTGTPARHMICIIPGGIRMEFIAMPRA